jgi:hypothetical protein
MGYKFTEQQIGYKQYKRQCKAIAKASVNAYAWAFLVTQQTVKSVGSAARNYQRKRC